jgi:DNA-binding MarR family transcriptional regulator
MPFGAGPRVREWMTAGDLARELGITTGGTTGVIRGLERKGYVTVDRGTRDKRQIIVSLEGPQVARAAAVFEAMRAMMIALLNGFTAAEQEVIARFADRGAEQAIDTLSALEALTLTEALRFPDHGEVGQGREPRQRSGELRRRVSSP